MILASSFTFSLDCLLWLWSLGPCWAKPPAPSPAFVEAVALCFPAGAGMVLGLAGPKVVREGWLVMTLADSYWSRWGAWESEYDVQLSFRYVSSTAELWRQSYMNRRSEACSDSLHPVALQVAQLPWSSTVQLIHVSAAQAWARGC